MNQRPVGTAGARAALVIAVSAVVGLILGFIGSNVLFVGQWYSLIVWGLVAGWIGTFSPRLDVALKAAATYGFVLVVAFLVTGYHGGTALYENVRFIGLIVILGLVGAGASMAAAWQGFAIRSRLRAR